MQWSGAAVVEWPGTTTILALPFFTAPGTHATPAHARVAAQAVPRYSRADRCSNRGDWGIKLENVSEQPEQPPHAVPADAGDSTSAEFEPTQTEERNQSLTDLWSESTDGQCSQNAALFAASQPAPLTVV